MEADNTGRIVILLIFIIIILVTVILLNISLGVIGISAHKVANRYRFKFYFHGYFFLIIIRAYGKVTKPSLIMYGEFMFAVTCALFPCFLNLSIVA